jgi:hypothetical protein
MARFGVRSGSVAFACLNVSAAINRLSERTRTGAHIAGPCHAEGRGFESHHPLSETPLNRGFLFALLNT